MFVVQLLKQSQTFKPLRDKQRIIHILILPLVGVWLCISGRSCFAHENLPTGPKPGHAVPSIKTKIALSKLQNTHWWQVARTHQLDPYILYAVALIESAKSNDLNAVTPWPWAINKSGKAIIPASKQEAHDILNKTIAEGDRNIDIGMMQINLHWHGHRVDKPEHLLNPVTNLEIGAKVLAEAIQSAPNNLVLGIGRYHSWQNVPLAVEYGQRVIALADQIRTLI